VMTGYGVDLKTVAYMVMTADLPAGSTFDYGIALKAIESRHGAKPLVATNWVFEGTVGKAYEMEITNPKGSGAGRMVVVDNRLYQLFVLGQKTRASDPDVQKFFDSFKIKR